MHLQQIAQLRGTIADMVRLSEQNSQIKQRFEVYDRLVPQLREANEHLILATFEARDSQAAAEALNRRQTEFISMLAHELRNPLHPIVLANNLIGRLFGEAPGLPALQAIVTRQTEQLMRLVDDLMDASRSDAGKMILQRRRLDVMQVIDSAVETSRGAIDARRQRLQLNAGGQPLYIDGDLGRLTQLFTNLLLNASKYTPEYGQLTIGIEADGAQVLIKISDNGAGIPLEIQSLVFELFIQGPPAPHSAPGGLGIGLALVRQIAQLHDGSVTVYSAGQGLGSVFTVTLPLAGQPDPAPQAAPRREVSAPTLARRILYIEDNADASDMLSQLLEMDGHTVVCRADGPSGLAAAQQGGFDAVIMDVGLPGLTGYAIARTLRQQPGGTKACLIALSGFDAAEPESTSSFSFDHYLVKPVSIPALRTILQQLDGPAPAPQNEIT
ncbi:hybrid sensor histidine kinase/response regulator [Duganella sp. PWIR1]